VNTLEVATLASAETEGRRHVDVALDPGTRGRALVIDEGGAVWMWWQNRLEAQERLVKTYKLFVSLGSSGTC